MVRQRTVRENLAAGFLAELAAFEGKPRGAGETFAPQLVHRLMQDAAQSGASDVHIEPGLLATTIRFRIDGVIADVAAVSKASAQLLVNQLKVLADLGPVASFTPRDAHATCVVDSGTLDLRLALTPSATGEVLAIRLLNPRRLQRSIDDLGLADESLRQIEEWLADSTGMFLSVGPTGSGKTTTIYSLLHVLRNSDDVVITLEDPVEYQVDGIVQVPLDLKRHLNFAEGVKTMLRLDPDYLMLGEVRDAVSARAAVDAAISGRVLLSTLHCRDAVSAVTALRNWGLLDHEIAEVLSVVVNQRLVRRLCPWCRRIRPTSEGERRWFASMARPAPEQVPEAVGCSHCGQIGYVGRTAVFELWRLEERDYDAILAHADEHALRRTLAARAHRSLMVDGIAKIAAGVTGVAELRSALAGLGPPA